MEKTIVDNKNREVSVGITYHLDLWALLSTSWFKYNHIEPTRIPPEDVVKEFNVPWDPRISGGMKHKTTGKCLTINIDFLCFRFFVEAWKWLA